MAKKKKLDLIIPKTKPIKPEQIAVNEELYDEFDKLLKDSLIRRKVNDNVKGKVLSISSEEAILQIGGKYDAILYDYEYRIGEIVDLTTVLAVGDEIEVKIEKLDQGEGLVKVSRKALSCVPQMISSPIAVKTEEEKKESKIGKIIVDQICTGRKLPKSCLVCSEKTDNYHFSIANSKGKSKVLCGKKCGSCGKIWFTEMIIGQYPEYFIVEKSHYPLSTLQICEEKEENDLKIKIDKRNADPNPIHILNNSQEDEDPWI